MKATHARCMLGAVLAALLVGGESCLGVRTDLLYACEDDGTCAQPGYTCDRA